MDRYEYMKLPLDIIPEEIIQQYNLRNLAHKGFYIYKSKRGCMGYPNKKNYIYPSFDIRQHPSPQVCGSTKLTPFNSHW